MYFANHNAKDKPIKNLNHLRAGRYWHRPGGVLQKIANMVTEGGLESPVELEGKYVEAYIAALFGAGLEKSEKRKVWLTKPKDDPPDMAFMVVVDKEGKIFFHSREIEITRHIGGTGNIRKTILNKIKHKAYPEEYVIVCYIEAVGFIDFGELAQDIQNNLEKDNKVHVFLVGHEGNPGNPKQSYTALRQLTPSEDKIGFRIKPVLDNYHQDPEKILYVADGEVFYGLRDEDDEIPNIV